MDEYEDLESKLLPRWVTIPLGVILIPFSLACIIGSLTIVLTPNVPSSFLTVSLGSLFLFGSIWMFYLSLRLLLVNPKGKSSLISPLGLRVVASVFVVIPIVSLIVGSFWEKPVIHSIMAIAYVFIALELWNMANHRKKSP